MVATMTMEDVNDINGFNDNNNVASVEQIPDEVREALVNLPKGVHTIGNLRISISYVE